MMNGVTLVLILLTRLLLCNAADVVRIQQLPLRTQGQWFIDQQGRRVKLVCVNWPGAHMNAFVPQGLHVQTSLAIAARIRSLGFNCVRLQWSLELFYSNPTVHPDSIRALADDTTANARALDVFDRVIQDLSREHIMVILDNHMSDAGWCCDPRDGNGLWFNDRYSVQMYEDAWIAMASRYIHEPFVIGADLRNEIRPDIELSHFRWPGLPQLRIRLPTWGFPKDGTYFLHEVAPELMNYTHPDLEHWQQRSILYALKHILGSTVVETYDWRSVAERLTCKLQQQHRQLIVLVPGVFDFHSYVPSVLQLVFYYLQHDQDLYKTIGRFLQIPKSVMQHYQVMNMTGMIEHPLRAWDTERLAYSAHVYPFYYEGSQWTWDGQNPSYEVYAEKLDLFWARLSRTLQAPLWIGETGTSHDIQPKSDPAWSDYTVRFLAERDLDFAYWILGDARPQVLPNGSFDAGADGYSLLAKDFQTASSQELLASFKILMEPRQGPQVNKQTMRTRLDATEEEEEMILFQ